MKRAVTTIVIIVTGMFPAGSTWAAGYGTGVDEQTKEIGGNSTYQQKSWMDIKKEQIQEDIQKQEQQIEQKGEEPTKEMQEKGKEMMPSNMDDMMKNK
jgi:hypothetical protein